MNPNDAIALISDEVTTCTSCKLHKYRINSVPGEGPETSDVMFIGEAPGKIEDIRGRPFQGASGVFLNELLAHAKIRRSETWIGNVIKCRPPDNRDPFATELAICGKYLDRQISAINPEIIVTLGRFAMGKFMPGATISKVHGQVSRVGNRYVIPMFHPAAALYDANLKPLILSDFAKLPEQINEARKALGRPDTLGQDKAI